MEVGAVKQAFNNEVILLKKSLNQAKIQTIHKLTRKAKTFTEKKCPEKIKEKLKRKAESAINEVLLIKKIKPKDIAKFIVTHKGELNSYLNKPIVDQDKACARLLLHKSLQEKYKVMRATYSNIKIDDLLMSRQERRKIKKEAKDKQKEKKEKKNSKVDDAGAGWKVEDVEKNDEECKQQDDSSDEQSDKEEVSGDDYDVDVDLDVQDDKFNRNSKKAKLTEDNEVPIGDEEFSDDGDVSGDDNDSDEQDDNFNRKTKKVESKADSSDENESVGDLSENYDNNDENSEDSNDKGEIGKFVRLTPSKTSNLVPRKELPVKANINKSEVVKIEKKVKDTKKNKNFNEKILLRKFKKETDNLPVPDAKIVDPFFITATGENYMSVAEPRQPDEVKEIHKQGNRKLRRAVMFGHVPIKPRQDYSYNSNRNEKFNEKTDNKWSQNSDRSQSGKRKHDFNDTNPNFNDKKSNFNDRKAKFRVQDEPEKLHPSWEAKKKQSGILPFQGKKIVFNDS